MMGIAEERARIPEAESRSFQLQRTRFASCGRCATVAHRQVHLRTEASKPINSDCIDGNSVNKKTW